MNIQVKDALRVARSRARTNRERAGIDIALGNCGELNAVCVQLQLLFPGKRVTVARARLACAISVLGLSARAARILVDPPVVDDGDTIEVNSSTGEVTLDGEQVGQVVGGRILIGKPGTEFALRNPGRIEFTGCPPIVMGTTKISDLAAGTVPGAIDYTSTERGAE